MRSIVITGASRGLGAALACHHAAPGVTLGLLARGAAGLDSVAAACRARGAEVRTAMTDVTDRAGLAAALLAFDAAAPTDLLIVNAGIELGPEPGAAIEEYKSLARVLDVNLTGAALTAAALLPAMQARGRGQVAFIASVAAYRGMPDSPAYCASKAGLRVLAEALRARLAADGVTVSIVLPSFFESAMSARWHGPKGHVLSAAAMAGRIAAGLARKRARIVIPRHTGLLMQVCDLLPAWLSDRLILRQRFRIDNQGGAGD